jgi:predicted porin
MGAGTSTTPADSTDYIQGIHAGASYDFRRAVGLRRLPQLSQDVHHVGRQAAERHVLGGRRVRLHAAFTLYGAVYKQNIKGDTDADPILFSVRAQYNLSKRTMAYLSAAYAKARNGQNVSVSRDFVGYANNQVGVTAGLQHRF